MGKLELLFITMGTVMKIGVKDFRTGGLGSEDYNEKEKIIKYSYYYTYLSLLSLLTFFSLSKLLRKLKGIAPSFFNSS